MLVINTGNLEILENGPSVRRVIERYEIAKLDLPEEVVKRLLRKGELVRSTMLRSWLQITSDDVEAMNIPYLSRNEMWAITRNPKIARLALKYREFVETLGPQSLGNAYDHISLEDIEKYDVRLADVIANPTVSVEVKRALIQRDFQDGKLPIRAATDLRKYAHADITHELVKQLEQINYPERLIDPNLLTRRSFKQMNDVSSRLLLSLCGCYDLELVNKMMQVDAEQLSVVEFCSWFKGPTTLAQTSLLLAMPEMNANLCKYIAAKGHFDDGLLKMMVDTINTHGDMGDMVALYENEHLSTEQRAVVFKQVSTCVPLESVRRRMFDQYLLDCNKSELDEFCQTWQSEPSLMFMIQSPRAYKVTALHCIRRINPAAITANDILTKCVNEKFTDHEAELLMSHIEADYDDDLVMRFLLMDGIADVHKKDLVERITAKRAA